MRSPIQPLALVVLAGVIAAAPGASAAGPRQSGVIVYASNSAVNLGWPDIFVVKSSGGRARNLTHTMEIDESQPAWSHDGARIAFSSLTRDSLGGSSDIFVMKANGSDVRRLTSDREIDESPAWSPNGKQIAFESFREQRPRIWLMDSNGGNQRPITSGGNAQQPTWSPDGKRIAFSGDDALEVVNADGSGRRRILNGDVFALRWSSTGRIGFARQIPNGNGDHAVYSVRPNGRGVRRLTRPGCDADDLAWSPTGASLVVLCRNNLWVARADGSSRRQLRVRPPADAAEQMVDITDLSWSRSGIAYAAVSEFNDSDIWSRNGSIDRRLTTRSMDELEPARAPHGTAVAYVGWRRAQGAELYLVDTQTRKVRRLTRNRVPDRSPAWSPDGRSLAFARAGDLFTMRRDGSGLRRLTRTPRQEATPAWAADGRIAFTANRSILVMSASRREVVPLGPGENPAWSPDATQLVFEFERAIYIMNGDGSGRRSLPRDAENPDSSPAWSPDGGEIVFARGKAREEIEEWGREFVLELFVVREDGSGLRPITHNTLIEEFHPSWQLG